MRISDWSSDVCSSDLVEIATDGACKGNPGPGGWGAVIRAGTREKDLSGGAADTTNNRMELTAVIEALRSEEHTSELQSLMRISYAVFFLKQKTINYSQSVLLHANT